MSLAYFPMYPDDYEADTAHLTLAEDGAYNRLLRLCWRTPGCSIPADRAWIYRRMRAHTEADQAVIETVLDEFFDLREGRLSNARLMKEWLAGNEAHARRVKAGSKGGKTKALKTNKTEASNAVAKPKQPEPEPEPYTQETDVSCVGARRRARKPEVPIPEGWIPSQKNIADAHERNFSDQEIEDEARRFRDHHLAKGSLFRDWNAAWRTWLGNARRFAPRVVAGREATGTGGRRSSLASIVAQRHASGYYDRRGD